MVVGHCFCRRQLSFKFSSRLVVTPPVSGVSRPYTWGASATPLMEFGNFYVVFSTASRRVARRRCSFCFLAVLPAKLSIPSAGFCPSLSGFFLCSP